LKAHFANLYSFQHAIGFQLWKDIVDIKQIWALLVIGFDAPHKVSLAENKKKRERSKSAINKNEKEQVCSNLGFGD
jgi:hypothetical protein